MRRPRCESGLSFLCIGSFRSQCRSPFMDQEQNSVFAQIHQCLRDSRDLLLLTFKMKFTCSGNVHYNSPNAGVYCRSGLFGETGSRKSPYKAQNDGLCCRCFSSGCLGRKKRFHIFAFVSAACNVNSRKVAGFSLVFQRFASVSTNQACF